MQIEERLLLLDKAKDNTDLQALEIGMCFNDPVYFFNTYLYTDKNDTFYSADTPSVVPFILYEFQEEYVKETWVSIIEWSKPAKERKPDVHTNVFIEKSRQMGISWVTCGIFLYWFLFHKHKYTIVSRTAEEVDSPWDMDSMFEKIRFMIKNIPDWMLPEWFSKTSGKDKTNRYMSMSDPSSQASITGKTANPDAWRWGTRNAIFMDEMAFMQYANQINKSAWSNTPCRIFNSTPNWEGNEFYRMRKLAEDGDIKRLRYHWSEHPHYDDEWYAQKTKWMTKEAIAQELEIDYNTAIVGRVYPEFKSNIQNIQYDPSKPMFISIDNSHWWADPHAVIVWQLDLKTHYWDVIDCISINCSVTDMAEFMVWNPKFQLNNSQLEFLERYKNYNWKRATFISDPYDTHSKLNNTTIFQEYQKVWINLNLPKIIDKKAQIQQTRSNLYRIRYNDYCWDFASAILNARYPEIKENTSRTTAADKPVHDWTSHYRTALEYWVWYLLQNSIKKKEHTKDTRPKRDYRTWKLIFSWLKA